MSEPSVTVELFDAAEMDVQIRKMAHQVLGDFPDEERIKLVGIRRRGVSVADRLAAHLSRITGRAFDQGEITLKRYSALVTAAGIRRGASATQRPRRGKTTLHPATTAGQRAAGPSRSWPTNSSASG
jgi:pyrimidine operon attenuation protein/uracil phosphoribosyltransferase